MNLKLMFRNLSLLLLLVVGLGSCYQQRRIVNGMNNLTPADWAGTYKGNLRGADGEGIATTIVFRNDGSYTRTSAGTDGVPYSVEGTAVWDQAQGLIMLQPAASSLSIPYRKTAQGIIMMRLGTGQRLREERPEYTLYKTTSDVPSGMAPTEHYWSLTALNGRAISMEIPGGRPHVLFHGSTGKTDGNGGCNTFSGTFKLSSGNTLIVSPLISTRMACAPGSVESEFFKVLEGTTTYEASDDRLTLMRNGKTVAVFEAVWMK